MGRLPAGSSTPRRAIWPAAISIAVEGVLRQSRTSWSTRPQGGQTMDADGRTATAGTPVAKQLGRVGLWTSKLDLQPADQFRSIITELEALGWGSLWSWEVFGREALTNAGLLLCTSQQLVIGTGIANIWARDPVAMAAAGRTLAEAYPGRFVLGLGVSHAPIVDARGHRYERPLERMRTYLDAMDAAPWQGPPLKQEPVRVLGPPGPRMLELAGERPAGALTYTAAPEAAAWARSILGTGPLLAVEQAVVVEQDPAQARRIAPQLPAFSPTPPSYVRAGQRAGFGSEELADGGSDRLVDAVVAWGSPEAIAERVTAHLEAGADHVCLQVLDPDPSALPMAACRALAPVLLERSGCQRLQPWRRGASRIGLRMVPLDVKPEARLGGRAPLNEGRPAGWLAAVLSGEVRSPTGNEWWNG